jgi:nucleoporin SEH1
VRLWLRTRHEPRAARLRLLLPSNDVELSLLTFAAMQTSLLSTGHASLITHLAYNFHGKRLATSSLDHSVRVTAPDSQFKAHDSPVLKVVWAHPEHGAVDGVVKIWVEEPSRNASGTSKWVSKASLTEARGSIRDLEFAPPEAGLKLAVVSSDSHLRLWECLDPVTLADWSLVEDIDLSILPTTPSSSMDKGAAPGTSAEGQSAGGSPQKLNAPGSSLAGSSTGSGNSFDGRKTGTVESDGGWSLSWCKESWWGEILAVSSGSSGIIRVSDLVPLYSSRILTLLFAAVSSARSRTLDQLPQSPPSPPSVLVHLPTSSDLLPRVGTCIRSLVSAASIWISRWTGPSVESPHPVSRGGHGRHGMAR